MMSRERQFGGRFFKIHNLNFKIILKKIWVVDNDVTYMGVKKSLRNLLYFGSCTNDKFLDLGSEQ
jgi:hypothetical protein